MILHTGWSNSAFNPKNWGGGGRDSKKSDTDKAVSQAINTKDDGSMAEKNYNASFADDIAMGLSTFGLTGQAQIDKLVEKGYSESAAKDYQARTAATQAANAAAAAAASNNDDNDNNSSATTTTTADDTSTDDTPAAADDGGVGTSATNTTTLDTSSSGTSEAITAGGTGTASSGVAEAEQIIAQADGPAEAAVAETAKKGRRANIQTTSQGLLTTEDDPNLRRRRSLMGGGLIN